MTKWDMTRQKFLLSLTKQGLEYRPLGKARYEIQGIVTSVRCTGELSDKPGQFWFDVASGDLSRVGLFVFLCENADDFFVFSSSDLQEILESLDAPTASRSGRLLFRIDMKNKLLIARQESKQDISLRFRNLSLIVPPC